MAKIAPWAFVLAVPDCQRSAVYFRDMLGFRILWEEAPDWRLVERDSVRIMIGHCPTDMSPADLASHNWFGYLDVDDVESLYQEFTERGVTCAPPVDRPYGTREIGITTIDGHRIVFGQTLR